jgi:hypothetical protein
MLSRSAVSIIISCVAFSVFAQTTSAIARKGPPIGTAAFKPVLGFNPTCTHKGTSPPVEDLGVNEYEDRVFGYVRYCALPEGDGVRVKIINEWTNGHRFDGDTVCSAHAWLKDDGTRVLTVTHRVGVNPRSSRLLIDPFLLTKSDFEKVASWSWRFQPCPQPRVHFCFNSSACEHKDWYPEQNQ